MELSEVFDKVKVQAQKTAELRAQNAAAKEQLSKVIDDNCREILLPEMANLLQILELTDTLHDAPDEISRLLEIEGQKVYVKACSRYTEIKYYDKYNNFNSCDIHYGMSCKSTGCTKLSAATFLSSVERTRSIISELRITVAEYLEKSIPAFEAENKELAESISELQSWLKTSDTVQQNDDGTVEFKIGGKTYIGTVKEA